MQLIVGIVLTLCGTALTLVSLAETARHGGVVLEARPRQVLPLGQTVFMIVFSVCILLGGFYLVLPGRFQ